MFGQEVSIWDNIENLKGNHEELSKLFVDGMAKRYGVVGNNKWFVTRDYNPTRDVVTFSVYPRETFSRALSAYLAKVKN